MRLIIECDGCGAISMASSVYGAAKIAHHHEGCGESISNGELRSFLGGDVDA